MTKTITMNFEGWKAGLFLVCALIGAMDITVTPFLIYFNIGKWSACIN